MKHKTPAALGFLDEDLQNLRASDLLRERPKPNTWGAKSFCSNDYLGLSARHASGHASGSGASRLVAGERSEHLELEQLVAELVGAATALTFTSGYAANVGTVAALASSDDLIVSDALNHASLIDGARLSRARVEIVPHLDLEAVGRALDRPRRRRAFVLTESYFSMDGDSPDLGALRRICDAKGAALLVDEAHALGVLGPEGRGLCAEHRIVPDVLIGTFGKAFGASGAFVAGCPALIQWLWNRARSFVFSTGLSPVLAAAAARAVRVSQAEPELRARVLTAALRLRSGLVELGIQPRGYGHIIPWVIGDARAALQAAAHLRGQGIDVLAIRPPTVPEGTSRIRLTVTAGHEKSDIDALLRAVPTSLGR